MNEDTTFSHRSDLANNTGNVYNVQESRFKILYCTLSFGSYICADPAYVSAAIHEYDCEAF